MKPVVAATAGPGSRFAVGDFRPQADAAPMRQFTALTLRRGFSWTFAGNAVFAASQMALLVIIARLGNATMLGQYSIALAITAPVFLATNLQLRSLQVTDPLKAFAFEDYWRLRLLTTPIAFLIIALVLLGMGCEWATAAVVGAMALVKAIDSFSDVCHGQFQQSERMDYAARSMLVRGPAGILAAAVVLAETASMALSVLAIALTRLIVLLQMDCKRISRVLPEDAYVIKGWLASDNIAWPKRPAYLNRVKTLAKMGIAPSGSVLLLALSGHFPTLLLSWRYDEQTAGIYAAVVGLSVACMPMIAAFSQCIAPRMAKLCSAGELRHLHSLLAKITVLALALGIVGILASSALGSVALRRVFGADYQQYASLLTLLMCTVIPHYINPFLTNVLTAMRCLRFQLIVHALSLAMLVILCGELMPRFGLMGVALASLVSASFRTLACYAMIVRFASLQTHHVTRLLPVGALPQSPYMIASINADARR